MAAARPTSSAGAPAEVPSLAKSTSSEIKTAVRFHFAGDETHSVPPLVGEPAQEYNFETKLAASHLLLEAGQKEDARTVFFGIIVNLGFTPVSVHSLICARCQLGIAFTYPPGPEKSKWVTMAKSELDRVYGNITSWIYLNNEEKKVTYVELIENYNTLVLLIAESDSIILGEINGKIKECERILASKQAVPESTAAPKAPPSSLKPGREYQTPKQVTQGPVSGSARIGTIFGTAIISLRTLFAGK